MATDTDSIRNLHRDMLRRCYSPKSILYKNYGAKGITVCDEWHDRETFRSWAIANGYKKGLRLLRKDTTQNYTPDNCFWGSGNKAKHGHNENIKARAKENKELKTRLGIKKLMDSPLYPTFKQMHDRCNYPSSISYHNYGERGIKVCDLWSGGNGFANFLKWVETSNWKPGLTLDRIDNNKGYSPDNCRWATRREQQKNTRKSKFYLYKGQELNLAEISEIENIVYSTLLYYVRKKKMSVENAIAYIKSKRSRA